jgi:hypothetical protein
MATIKKAQNGAKTKDSTAYYSNKARLSELKGALSNTPSEILRNFNASDKAKKDQSRQKYKGKPGYDANGFSKKKNGGPIAKAKDGKWIQKAINPKHKGFCTPQTKATCTPKRKALAQTLRKIAKKKK